MPLLEFSSLIFLSSIVIFFIAASSLPALFASSLLFFRDSPALHHLYQVHILEILFRLHQINIFLRVHLNQIIIRKTAIFYNP